MPFWRIVVNLMLRIAEEALTFDDVLLLPGSDLVRQTGQEPVVYATVPLLLRFHL